MKWLGYKIDNPEAIKIPDNSTISKHAEDQAAKREIDISIQNLQSYINDAVIMFYQKKQEEEHYKYLFIGPDYSIIIGKLSENDTNAASFVTPWRTFEKYSNMNEKERNLQKTVMLVLDEVIKCITGMQNSKNS
jgi:hypothetical protein